MFNMLPSVLPTVAQVLMCTAFCYRPSSLLERGEVGQLRGQSRPKPLTSVTTTAVGQCHTPCRPQMVGTVLHIMRALNISFCW
jgi:hypothetical protein